MLLMKFLDTIKVSLSLEGVKRTKYIKKYNNTFLIYRKIKKLLSVYKNKPKFSTIKNMVMVID